MGTIIISGGKTLTISPLSTKQLNMINPVPPMNLTYSYSSGTFLFSIENILPEIQTKLNAGKYMRLQLVRYTRSKSVNKDQNKFLKPSFPSFIGANNGINVLEEHKANIRIDNLPSYTDMNLTTWFSNMIKWGSAAFDTNMKSFIVNDFRTNNGYWYQKYSFCILIDNAMYFFDNAPLFEVRMYNDGDLNINTNYLVNTSTDIITVYSL